MNFIEHVLEPNRVLLVWQGAEGSSRIRHTVAELVRENGGTPVRLRYLTHTMDFSDACREGFIHFPAFGKLDVTYDVGVLETFMRRLPPRSRGDYGQYLSHFRLRPETCISDFALLAYTGAKLPSDGFCIVNPLDDATAPGELLIEIAGFRHASQLSWESLRVGEEVTFVREPDNAFDHNAVAIFLRDHRIGYVPRQQAVAVGRLFEEGVLSASVERVNGRPERPLIFLFTALQSR